ncbi:cytochrome P450 [Crepidotus variabilis]|uniref:Cytochrome P450 n=1 Tax=Crepidotus variabilis TaxID=179855 RepID=A0A9P6JNJ5_9AGAR|nr:cytochrome P450 [Crepidotus variabilis]
MAAPLGIIYLTSILPFLVVPPTLTYAILRALNSRAGVSIPTWFTILAVLLSRPLSSIFQRHYKRYADSRDATASRAYPIPTVASKAFDFGGFKLMKSLVKDIQTNYPGEMFGRWTEEYGPVFQLQLPSDDRIVTIEPDHIKAILATQFDSFYKGPVLFKQFRSLLGEGVFNSDGELWKFHRSMARPYFSRDRISHFDNFEEHAANALSQAEKRLAEGYAIDFQDVVARFTLDSATQFLFGYDVQSLSAGLPYPEAVSHLNTAEFLNHPSNAFVDAFAEGQQRTSWRTRRGPIWPLMEFWKDDVQPFRKIVEGYIEPLLHKAIKKKDLEEVIGDKKETGDSGDTLLEDLIQQTRDVEILKDELINLLVAGRDTTASTLTFAFYMLAEHPEIEARLRKEIISTVGPNKRPTYDDIREMKYLRAFINEVLRLYPAVPVNNRTSSKSTVWTSKTPGSKPYYVPAGTRILYSVFLMHRRTDLWGPDALKFDPDRFLDDRVQKYLTPNPYIFLPFNAGPRICLGQQFAYQETSFFLIRLMQRFVNFKMAPNAQPEASKPPAHWAHGKGSQVTEKVWPLLSLTMAVRGGLWVTMDPLKQ